MNYVSPFLRFLCLQFYESHVLCKLVHRIFLKDGPWAKKGWEPVTEMKVAVRKQSC